MTAEEIDTDLLFSEVVEVLCSYRYEMQVRLLSMRGLIRLDRMTPKTEVAYNILVKKIDRVDRLLKELE